jgi:ATP-dependent Zn protease
MWLLQAVIAPLVDDIQRATQFARRMVAEFGMSEKLGSVRYARQQSLDGRAVLEALASPEHAAAS